MNAGDICPYCKKRPIPVSGKGRFPRRSCGTPSCKRKHEALTSRLRYHTPEAMERRRVRRENRTPEQIEAERAWKREYMYFYRIDTEYDKTPKYRRISARSTKRYYEKMKAEGRCTACGSPAASHPDGRTMTKCDACRAKERIRFKEYRLSDRYIETLVRQAETERDAREAS